MADTKDQKEPMVPFLFSKMVEIKKDDPRREVIDQPTVLEPENDLDLADTKNQKEPMVPFLFSKMVEIKKDDPRREVIDQPTVLE